MSFIVTWKFEGIKQSKMFASSGGADRHADWLRRRGGPQVKEVKVRPTSDNPIKGQEATQFFVDEAAHFKSGCTHDCFCNCNGSCRLS